MTALVNFDATDGVNEMTQREATVTPLQLRGTEEQEHKIANSQIRVRNTFIEVVPDEPGTPCVTRSTTCPDIAVSAWKEIEEDDDEEKEDDEFEGQQGEEEEVVQACRLQAESDGARHSKLNPHATPFFPEAPEAASPRKTLMSDPIPLRLRNEMQDLSPLVDSLIADAQGFKLTLSKVMEEDTMAGADPTEAHDFMNHLLESLNGLCECTPKEGDAVRGSETPNLTNVRRNRRTLDVPHNTPAGAYCQDNSPSCSGVANRFAMERSEDVLCCA